MRQNTSDSKIAWEKRKASIADAKGKVIFEQDNVEVPSSWSQTATNIVVNKYFRGAPDSKEREHSVRQLIDRVAKTITAWGEKDGYFGAPHEAQLFLTDLTSLLLHQKMAFNSPVWFNVGVETHPQCSACFINSVDDTMESILNLAKTEALLFKFGSGTGTNFSTLRSSKESLKGGGTASGPVSFMRGFDSFAAVIKSGGKTRRAAKMVILNADHPDILDFIDSKRIEEEKASALISAGYDAGFNVPGGAYDSVSFQNANHSVRVTDEFMRAVESDSWFETKAVTDQKPQARMKAREIWRRIAEAAWRCGDPGIQFDTTINRFHTCKTSGRIQASNPCSEYMFLDDSACNLASLNLLKFRSGRGLDIASFKRAVETTILAQEIIVGNASYPTKKIRNNSLAFRPLGLGYANLGALLMANGLPYDSDEGRALAASITALMTGHAYATSARLAKRQGAFDKFASNRKSFMDVIGLHQQACGQLRPPKGRSSIQEILDAANSAWTDAHRHGAQFGFRNAQVTVLAPTGTIGFMMDCDTTGVEPDIALVKYKSLVGGGLLKIVNQTVPVALEALGYDEMQREEILRYVEKNDTIEGAPKLGVEDLAVFDCAFRPKRGIRAISPMGHVRMMEAVQPFLSGAISKTVNMPNDATVDDIAEIYFEAWKRGIKAIALYRDGCKQSQPLSASKSAEKEDVVSGPMIPIPGFQSFSLEDFIEAAKDKKAQEELGKRLGMVVRRHLPSERPAITHKFSVGGHEGYLTVGLFEDGSPGELFCTMAKAGSTISGLMDVFAVAISLALQYGVPISVLVEKFSHTRFEPSGLTGNKEIPIAKSITDYIFRWVSLKFDSAEKIQQEHQEHQTADSEEPLHQLQLDAPPCHQCGAIMVRNGSCYKCMNCGSTSGCS